jgi:hypothetical protein
LSLSAGEITITGYSNPGRALQIPAFIDGFPAKVLAVNALAGKPITSVTIGKGVHTIGGSAFESSQQLTSVSIPHSI